MKTTVILGLALAATVPTAHAAAPVAPPAFVTKPTATRDGDAVRIAFAVSAPTDVAVYVEDDKGRAIRHLAAGVLGPNAPEPLQKDSLAQNLVWDGRDDDGKKAEGGPFKVRVGLGLKPVWGGVAFAKPEEIGPNRIEGVIGLATGPDGRLYVLDLINGWGWFKG
ncbi:MAG: hypothetical protein N3A38_17415, partial [Planctomycetota bacterium]|nr:hypothetical protein [Planctomycetota bacterium]